MAVYKCEKSLYNLNDKDLYFVQVGNLKQALNYGLTLKKVYRVIKFMVHPRNMPLPLTLKKTRSKFENVS